MKTRKKILEEEPAWKKRRRDMQKQSRSTKIWMVVGIALATVVVVFMGYIAVRSLRPHAPKELAKGKMIHAIAHVTDKRVDREGGKTEQWITFRVGKFVVDQKVDQAKYDSLKKDQDVLMSYQVDPATRKPRIRDWEPYVEKAAAK